MFLLTENYNCKQCDSEFSYERTLKIRMEQNHEGRFSCKLCQFRFKTKDKLEEHINREHEADDVSLMQKIVTCNICKKTGNKESDLKRHMKYMHAGEKWKHEEENIVVKRKKIDEVQVITNGTSGKVDCGICGKLFFNKSNMTRHKRKAH